MDELRSRQKRLSKFLLVINLAVSLVFIGIVIYLAFYSQGEEARFFYDASSAVEQVKGAKTARIEGASDVRGVGEEEKTATFSKASIVKILHRYCYTLLVTKTLGLPKTNYQFCSADIGSGFFISDKGHIATNGHVVKTFDTQALANAIKRGDLDNIINDIENLNDEPFAAEQFRRSQTKTDKLLAELTNYYNLGKIRFEKDSTELFVQTGHNPLELKSDYRVKEADGIYSAILIDIDYENPSLSEDGFLSSDIAILKIAGDDFPGLPIGSIELIRAGSKILSLGYPRVAENSALLDKNSSVEPTVSTGIVSAIKRASGNQKFLIQTDTSVNQGSSGGPLVELTGNVVGIVTYGLTPKEGTGNYNFSRDVNDLVKLMQKNGIQNTTGQTYENFKNGALSYFSNDYEGSVKLLSSVIKTYPSHQEAQKLLRLAKLKLLSYEKSNQILTEDGAKDVLLVVSSLIALGSLILSLRLLKREADVELRLSNITSSLAKKRA